MQHDQRVSVAAQAKAESMSHSEMYDFVYADLYQLYDNDKELLEQVEEELDIEGVLKDEY